jgi:hypothetical protein
MPTIRTILLGAVAALMLALLPASAASAAKVPIRVGLADQSYTMFDQDKFHDLNIKRTRYFIKWNAIDDDYQLQQADIFVDLAKQHGVEVFMTPSTHDLRRKRGKLPSVKQYKRKVGALVDRYRGMGVKVWGVWNEANHDSQPTYKSPKRAAQYYKAMYGMCKGCTIVGLDVLDQRGVERYIDDWYRSLGRKWRNRAKLVGIHNYSDVNRKRMSGTQAIVKTVRSSKNNRNAKFWLTETGGLVEFGGAWKCNEKRAANRIKYMFRSAKKQRSYVQRLYAYAYWGNDCEERFDAGLVNADGSARPGYNAFKKGARNFLR